MEMDVRTEGVDEVERMLQSLNLKQQTRIVHAALNEGAQIIKQAIEESAPVNEWPLSPKSTALAPDSVNDDIIIRIRGEGEKMIAVIGPGSLTERIARWVEYGHRQVRGGYSRIRKNGNISGKGKVIGQVDAHPFIRPAYERVRAEAGKKIGDVLVKKLLRAVKRKG